VLHNRTRSSTPRASTWRRNRRDLAECTKYAEEISMAAGAAKGGGRAAGAYGAAVRLDQRACPPKARATGAISVRPGRCWRGIAKNRASLSAASQVADIAC
jgi:hypothetical protein